MLRKTTHTFYVWGAALKSSDLVTLNVLVKITRMLCTFKDEFEGEKEYDNLDTSYIIDKIQCPFSVGGGPLFILFN